MINESSYWKSLIAAECKALIKYRSHIIKNKDRRRFIQEIEHPRFDYKMERFFFITAYALRKLAESKKLSDEFEAILMPTNEYARTSPYINRFNCHVISKHYDLDKPKKGSLSVKYLYDKLIHSYVFVLGFNFRRKSAQTLFFNSDKSKGILYEIELNKYLRLLEICIDDDIVYSYTKLTKDGEMEYIIKSNTVPNIMK